MAMTQYNGDPEVISKLGTTPQERGLTTEQFKAKFDEGLKAFVEWFNDTHKTDFDAVQTELTSHKAEHLRIEKGVSPPENPNSKTFWLENLGESIDFVFGDGLLIGNASTDGSDDVWFDENI